MLMGFSIFTELLLISPFNLQTKIFLPCCSFSSSGLPLPFFSVLNLTTCVLVLLNQSSKCVLFSVSVIFISGLLYLIELLSPLALLDN